MFAYPEDFAQAGNGLQGKPCKREEFVAIKCFVQLFALRAGALVKPRYGMTGWVSVFVDGDARFANACGGYADDVGGVVDLCNSIFQDGADGFPEFIGFVIRPFWLWMVRGRFGLCTGDFSTSWIEDQGFDVGGSHIDADEQRVGGCFCVHGWLFFQIIGRVRVILY